MLSVVIYRAIVLGIAKKGSAALQWSDIDFETGLLNINKTLYYKSMDEYKYVAPKTQPASASFT